MKFVSWNVNGFRSCLTKGFSDFFTAADADFVCLQETKMQPGQADFQPAGYEQFWYSAEKKGYSGTAIFAKQKPIATSCGIGVEEMDHEGRVIMLEYPEFQLVTVYTPNSQRELTRLDFRMAWEDAFRDYLTRLRKNKPVIVCGDMNVAAQPIDLANPKTNEHNAGYTAEEREKFAKLLESGFTDTFRALHPDEAKRYSWWSYMANSRARNIGWRIDYFLTADIEKEQIVGADILDTVTGSDHAPVTLEVKF